VTDFPTASAAAFDRLVSSRYAMKSVFVTAIRLPQRQAALGLLDWANKYLGDHFPLSPSRMHQWLADQLDALSERRGRRINLLGPRGSAKSTVATLAYVLRAAAAGWEPYIWIISDTAEQAQLHLDNVKTELIENRLLRRAYRIRPGWQWRKMALSLRNGVTIECFGMGQRIRGRRRRAARPSLIICDDLQNDRHMDSVRQRENSRRWFHGTLMQAGTPHTNVVHLATALHIDALALELARTPGWITGVFRSIEHWPTHMPLWGEWEKIYSDPTNPQSDQAARDFYEARKQEMDLGAEVLWREREDLYELMTQRLRCGHPAFEREKQSSPIDPERCEWPAEYFEGELWFENWPHEALVRTMALDPSKGTDARRGDYSAFVMLSVDAADGVLYVEANLARRDAAQIVADGVELVRQFRPQRFVIENNQFQSLFEANFIEQLKRAGIHDIVPMGEANTVSKLVRIRGLGPHLAQHRIRFKQDSPATKLLVDQLRQFPIGDHDDGPDALEMAIRAAGQMLAPPRDDGLGSRLA